MRVCGENLILFNSYNIPGVYFCSILDHGGMENTHDKFLDEETESQTEITFSYGKI